MILLDTDVMIDLLRRYPPAVAWLESLGNIPVALPGYVIMELMLGCKNKREQTELLKAVKSCVVLWPSESASNNALSLFAKCYRSHGVGVLDMLIAMISIETAVPLHTFNTKHYGAIPGLTTRQPYKK